MTCPRLRSSAVLGALLFGLWTLGWLLLPFLLTWSLPGLLSFQGHEGLYDLPHHFLGEMAWLLFPAVFAVAFALAWLCLRLLLPSQSMTKVIAALCWAFSSRSLNAAVIAYLAALLGLQVVRFELGSRFESGWILIVAAMMLSAFAAWFLALNPRTASRPLLVAWWRPYWPGIPAFLTGILLMIVLPRGTDLLLDVAEDRIPTGWWVLAHLVDIVLGLATEAIALVVWWNRGHWSSVREGLRRLMTRPVLSAYLVYLLLCVGLLAVVAVPTFVLGAFEVYVVPQYQTWATAHGVALPLVFEALVALTRWVARAEIGILLMVVGLFFYLLGISRLLAPMVAPQVPEAVDGVGR